MSSLSALITKPNNNKPSTLQGYTKSLRRAVELLVSFGIVRSPNKDLKSSVDDVITKLEEDEILLHGKPLIEDVLEKELREAYAESAELELLQEKIERRIAFLSTEKKFEKNS